MKCSCSWCSSALCCGQRATCSCAEIILYLRMVGSEERPGTTRASLFSKGNLPLHYAVPSTVAGAPRSLPSGVHHHRRPRAPAATIAEPLDRGAVVVTEADESV